VVRRATRPSIFRAEHSSVRRCPHIQAPEALEHQLDQPVADRGVRGLGDVEEPAHADCAFRPAPVWRRAARGRLGADAAGDPARRHQPTTDAAILVLAPLLAPIAAACAYDKVLSAS
jgi:hypothetical protein